MRPDTPNREYYRRLRHSAATFRVDLPDKRWCDLWHQHFDWDGFGNLGWVHRRRHLNALLLALCRARHELSESSQPSQLFAAVYPRSSADDAIYVHTENPNGTPFPFLHDSAEPVPALPVLLDGRVDLNIYTVRLLRWDGEWSYLIEPAPNRAFNTDPRRRAFGAAAWAG